MNIGDLVKKRYARINAEFNDAVGIIVVINKGKAGRDFVTVSFARGVYTWYSHELEMINEGR